MTVRTQDIPYVAEEQRVEVEALDAGFFRVVVELRLHGPARRSRGAGALPGTRPADRPGADLLLHRPRDADPDPQPADGAGRGARVHGPRPPAACRPPPTSRSRRSGSSSSGPSSRSDRRAPGRILLHRGAPTTHLDEPPVPDTVSTTAQLTLLGRVTTPAGSPADAVLERVPNPEPGITYLVRFACPEFTSLCPVTGQPDFAHLVIDYVPGDWLVESKALKLFLGSFRNHGGFHEGCTLTVGKRIVDAHPAALAPDRWLLVPARRDADRRVLADRRAAGGALAAGPGGGGLSRAGVTATARAGSRVASCIRSARRSGPPLPRPRPGDGRRGRGAGASGFRPR